MLAIYPLVRAFYHFEIDYNEGWNGYLQQRAMAGKPLYSGLGPYWFNNYPPLSFYLVGLLGKLTGDVILAGRLLSLVGLAGCVTACGSAVRAVGGAREDARLAAATALLLFTVFATDYLGMNDPQLMAMGLAAWALAIHLGGPDSSRRSAIAALLLGLSLLIKHNLLLLPLLVAVDVIRRGNRQSRLAFFGAGMALAVLASALILASEGGAFLGQLLASRQWSVDRAFLFTVEILGRYQAPLALVVIGLVAARRTTPAPLILAWLLLALALGAYFSGGAGTDINVWFDVTLALAIGAGLAVRELRKRGGSPTLQIALALAINAGAIFQAPLALGRMGVDLAGDMAERQRQSAADVAWLRAQPGPAICESLWLCLRAGQPMFYDSFNSNQAMQTGRLPPGALVAMIRRHEIPVVVVSSRMQHAPGDLPGQAMPARFVNFEDDALLALDQHYDVVRIGPSGRFYRPKPTPSTSE